MAIEVMTITAPAYWASALVNGDYSGLGEQEAAWCREWQQNNAPWYVVDVARDDAGEAVEPYFTWSYALHACGCCDDNVRGGDVLEYVAHKREA